MTLKKLLKNILTKKELEELNRSFEVIGNIAIIEIPISLVKKEKIIGETIIKNNKHITTVVKKNTKHTGNYRIQKKKL